MRQPNRAAVPEGGSLAERYFEFLRTPYKTDGDGGIALPASAKYVEALQAVHAAHQPRWDLSACLAGTQEGFDGKVWFWSDTHFGHANIIKYCQRPFIDVSEMDNALLSNCLSTVSERDILVFGGDICMRDVERVNALLRAIPAYKINVLGNHDVQNRTPLGLAVDESCACLDFEHAGTRYLVTHQPVPQSMLERNQVNFHGHIHDSPLHPALGDGSRHINLSVEGLGFTPRTLEQLLQLRAGRASG